MAAETTSEKLATETLSRALELWMKGCQVIPLGSGSKPSKDLEWLRWVRQRQTQSDVERLFADHPPAVGVGIIECSSVFGPRVADDDDALWNRLLAEDSISTKPQGVDEEWLFTGKFEFFDQLESIRQAKAVAILAAKAAEGKTKPPVGLPVTKIRQGDLQALFADEGAARLIVRLLGIPEHNINAGNFLCVLPGHEEQHPSAHLYEDNKGCFSYTCFHLRADDWMTRTLPDVYYAQKIRTAEKLLGHDDEEDAIDKRKGGPMFAVWALRLLAEAGVLQPIDDVGLPELNGNVSDAVRKVYDGIKLLFSVRWTYSPGDAAPISWRFAAEWCDVSQVTAGKAMHELLRLGVIHAAGKFKNTTLFLLGRPKRVVRSHFRRK